MNNIFFQEIKRRIKSYWPGGLAVALIFSGSLITITSRQPAAVEVWQWPQLITKNDLFHITDAKTIQELARYDIVILNLDAWRNTPEAIDKILALNPDIKLLINLQISQVDAGWAALADGNLLSHGLYAGVDERWWARNTQGEKMYYYTTQFPLLNLTQYAPRDSKGRNWADWFVDYSASLVDSSYLTGRVHGFFLDVAIDEMSWYSIWGDWDLNNDGQADPKSFIDKAWQAGLHETIENLRATVGEEYILLTNGQNTAWDWANGQLDENFDFRFVKGVSGFDASREFMDQWKKQAQLAPVTNVIWSYGSSEFDFRSLRYGLASAAVFDAYFGWWPEGIPMHQSPVWFDEYGADLGQSLGRARHLTSGLWRRDFERGIILVNPTTQGRNVSLDGTFRKIKGSQSPAVNNGSVVTSIYLQPKDGIVLLK